MRDFERKRSPEPRSRVHFVTECLPAGEVLRCTASGIMPSVVRRGCLFWARFVPTCNGDFVTRPRAIGHLMRGVLACTLPWRLGALPAFSPQHVEEADNADRVARRSARAIGGLLGDGIPY